MHLLVRIEIAIAKDQIAFARARGIFRATGHLGEKGISNVAENQPKRMRTPRHQAAAHAIRAIVQARRNGSYVLARPLVHAVAVVGRPRHAGVAATRPPPPLFTTYTN